MASGTIRAPGRTHTSLRLLFTELLPRLQKLSTQEGELATVPCSGKENPVVGPFKHRNQKGKTLCIQGVNCSSSCPQQGRKQKNEKKKHTHRQRDSNFLEVLPTIVIPFKLLLLNLFPFQSIPGKKESVYNLIVY